METGKLAHKNIYGIFRRTTMHWHWVTRLITWAASSGSLPDLPLPSLLQVTGGGGFSPSRNFRGFSGGRARLGRMTIRQSPRCCRRCHPHPRPSGAGETHTAQRPGAGTRWDRLARRQMAGTVCTALCGMCCHLGTNV